MRWFTPVRHRQRRSFRSRQEARNPPRVARIEHCRSKVLDELVIDASTWLDLRFVEKQVGARHPLQRVLPTDADQIGGDSDVLRGTPVEKHHAVRRIDQRPVLHGCEKPIDRRVLVLRTIELLEEPRERWGCRGGARQASRSRGRSGPVHTRQFAKAAREHGIADDGRCGPDEVVVLTGGDSVHSSPRGSRARRGGCASWSRTRCDRRPAWGSRHRARGSAT